MKPDDMSDIEFVPLSEIDPASLIELMNNKKVARLMPLLSGAFSVENYHDFIRAKRQMWDQYGFGPWGIHIEGEFAGWGGLQPEQGDADFALVLHPNFWGWGGKIFARIKEWAFDQMKFDSITILFPPNRSNAKAIIRMGFTPDGELELNGEIFTRFRLLRNV